jgi:hypothetical protein
LYVVSEAGELLGTVPLGDAAPAGPPVPVDDGYLLATDDGVLRRLAADGGVTAELDTGEPIAAQPTVMDKVVLVVGFDGTLRKLAMPE